MDSLPILNAITAGLETLMGTNQVYQFPPPMNEPIEVQSWVLDADMEFEDQQNHRLETWTFTMDYWVGSATSEKDRKWEEAWRMRDRCIQHFGDPINWSLSGTVENSKLHVGEQTIRQMQHGEAIWIVLCLSLEAVRFVNHGN